MESWTPEWPTKPGSYWFYGYRFCRFDEADKPELCFVQVRMSGNKKPMYVTHGHFMYKEGGASGLWQKAVLPELPKE